MSSPAPSRYARRKNGFGQQFERFWQRVTEGMQLNQLWAQFRSDTRASYRFYSKEIDSSHTAGMSHFRRFLYITEQFFWAVIEKLTPARRVLLLIALILLLLGGGASYEQTGRNHIQFFYFNSHFYGGVLMFLLLMLEIGDRVIMKRDLQIAKEIQQWLLPAKPPTVPGLEVAFVTRPANTVAGDFYDVFPRSGRDGTWLLAVADVAGKSMPAALLMASFQASLKTLSTVNVTLNDLAAGINNYACTNSQQGRRFTTAFLGEYVPETRTLTYINAGHNDPMLRRASGQLERLSVGGIPLGILDGAVYQSATVTLNPGDWLVIFTDGVVEAENATQQEFGEDRLLQRINAGMNLPPAAMLEQILKDLDSFVGTTPQHDDITCMLIKAT
jgi:sigma-B regulation protein RsbU (phosphoserine phosphatase)